MLSNEQITLIIKALDDNYEVSLKKLTNKYETAKQCIQEMCNHPNNKTIKIGDKCTVCGKILKYY